MNQLDNDKEELRPQLLSIFWEHQARRKSSYEDKDPYTHECTCGKQMGASLVDDAHTELVEHLAFETAKFVTEYTQSKLKAFAGEVEALLANSEYIPGNPLLGKLAPRPKRSIDSENELKSDLRESLKAIKEKAGIE